MAAFYSTRKSIDGQNASFKEYKEENAGVMLNWLAMKPQEVAALAEGNSMGLGIKENYSSLRLVGAVKAGARIQRVEFIDICEGIAVYFGELKNGKKNGLGVCTYSNGDIYQGMYKNDELHGLGVYKFAGGSVYEGAFENSNRHGQGVRRFANGDVYEGAWENNKMHGRGVYRYANGRVERGLFRDGKFIG